MSHHRLVLLGLDVEPVSAVEEDGLVAEALGDGALLLEDHEPEVRNPLAGGSRLRLGHALAADAHLGNLNKMNQSITKQ